jgi:hypothetical protein
MVTAPVKTLIVDCDTHFWEPPDLADAYVEPALRERVRAGLERAGLQIQSGIHAGMQASRRNRGGLDPRERLKWMEAEGIYANIMALSTSSKSTIPTCRKRSGASSSAKTRGGSFGWNGKCPEPRPEIRFFPSLPRLPSKPVKGLSSSISRAASLDRLPGGSWPIAVPRLR